MPKNPIHSERILSIDILRGFDMFFIIFADRFFAQLNKEVHSPITEFLAIQFEHPEWVGSTFYDIIMPLFLFVVGAVIPFSLSKRIHESKPLGGIYRKIARRFFILFFLGWIVQGNLLAFDIAKFHIFSNTLQAIAVGYLFSSLLYIHLKKKWLWATFILCLICYAFLSDVSTYTGIGNFQLIPENNFPLHLDRSVFGKFDDGTQYTWLLSSLGFIATTLSGVFAGELIRSGKLKQKTAFFLVLYGLIMLFSGLLLGLWLPVVKKLWTSSFVLASSGICYLLLAFFYWVIDVKGKKKWTFMFKVIGVNAITAYVLSHVLDFPKIANSLLYGLKQYTGAYYDAITVLGGFGLLYLLLWYMYKNKTFIKI